MLEIRFEPRLTLQLLLFKLTQFLIRPQTYLILIVRGVEVKTEHTLLCSGRILSFFHEFSYSILLQFYPLCLVSRWSIAHRLRPDIHVHLETLVELFHVHVRLLVEVLMFSGLDIVKHMEVLAPGFWLNSVSDVVNVRVVVPLEQIHANGLN